MLGENSDDTQLPPLLGPRRKLLDGYAASLWASGLTITIIQIALILTGADLHLNVYLTLAVVVGWFVSSLPICVSHIQFRKKFHNVTSFRGFADVFWSTVILTLLAPILLVALRVLLYAIVNRAVRQECTTVMYDFIPSARRRDFKSFLTSLDKNCETARSH